jgi:transposase-like protein
MSTTSPTNPAIPHCPRCRAKRVIKKGTRRTRHEARQRWGCNACGHTFINQITKSLSKNFCSLEYNVGTRELEKSYVSL